MNKFIFSILFITQVVFAGFPPTTTKGSGDANPVTTFQISTPNIPITHSGTTATLGTVAIGGGGTGGTSATAGFNNLSPLSTKGDIVTRDSTNNIRLGVGTDGWVLTADSAQTAGIKWSAAGGTPSYTIVSKTSTYSAAINDYIICSSSSFTITLPTAVGQSGKAIVIQHNGTSLTQVYTLNTTSAQTIGGVASGSYALYTNGETLTLISDGSNWQVADHKTATGWIDGGANTITATTTSPVQTGNTKTQDKIYWMRDGAQVHIRSVFVQTAAGTNTAGTGDYLFAMPANITIDTSTITLFTTVLGRASLMLISNSFGSAQAHGTSGGNGDQLTGTVSIYDSTHFRLVGAAYNSSGSTPSSSSIAAAVMPINTAAVQYVATFTVPVSGWQP